MAGVTPSAWAMRWRTPAQGLLVKTGFSYGAEFDRLLAERRVPPAGATGEVTVLARMLAADRADWTPLAFEEAQWLAERQPGVRALRFSDAPAGNLRYLYCNKAVPTEWLRRLDAALPEHQPLLSTPRSGPARPAPGGG
jgi:polar amino acid transport system substrate-binding protein